MNILENINSNFVKLCEKQIKLIDNTIDDKDMYIYNIDYGTHMIYDLNEIRNETRNGSSTETRNEINYHTSHREKYFIFHDTDGLDEYDNDRLIQNKYQLLRFNIYSNFSIIFPYINWDHELIYKDNLKCYDKFFKNNSYITSNFIGKLEKRNDKYVMIYYGNKKIMELMNKCNHRYNTFVKLLENNIVNKNKISVEDELNVILNDIPNNYKGKNKLKFNFLKDEIKLFNYQLNDIKWMSNIKNDIDNNNNNITINYYDNMMVMLDDNKYIINNINKKLVKISNERDLESYSKIIRYYGGNIISSVGLGKTLIVLSYLILHSVNEYDKYIEYEKNKCNYFYKRGQYKGTNCQKSKVKELYCNEHKDSIFIEKRCVNFVNLDDLNLREIIVNKDCKNYFKSNANIIICPNHLCDQWVREYYNRFKQTDEYSKRVLLIVTYYQYTNLTFGDILFADIIVISYNIFLNSNYLKLNKQGKDILDILDDYDRKDNITINDIINTKSSSNIELNLLSNFMFNSVILDEVHEIINRPKSVYMNTMITSLKSMYKWNITGTPFPNGKNSFINDINYIIDCDLNNVTHLITKDIVKSFNHLYRRNTSETIKTQFNEVNSYILNNKLKLLEFTEQERRIYDSHSLSKNNRDFLIKLCCDPTIDENTNNIIKNCKTFSEIENVILCHNKRKLTNLKSDIILLENEKEEIINELNKRKFTLEYDILDIEIKNKLSTCKRNITNKKKEYDNIYKTYNYLKNAILNINVVDTCPICLEDINNEEIVITKCGHKFCKDCISIFIESINSHIIKCPKCNTLMNKNEVYLLQNNEIMSDNSVLGDLIQTVKSTKIGNIIYYIKNEFEKNDKCILFSQWDSLLYKIGHVLENNKIPVLYCKGTVYQRNKAINNFQQNNECNVICLSSKNSASGINLTAANKIILIEPVYGTKQYRKDIENQAIGRSIRLGQTKPVEIIKFIVKDTIEEEIYNDNLNEDLNEDVLEL